VTLFAGIDLGTSGAKLCLVDEDDRFVESAVRALPVSRPQPGWSEQDPQIWIDALTACFDELAACAPADMACVAGIGLSGQMLGAVLLDGADQPVRPAILWNDQRALAECDLLVRRVPDIGRRTNGAPDPGFVAPKLLWLRAHEPEALDTARMLLLPKDYVRLWLTGERASEPTDAGGTMLLDCATGAWDAALCDAVGWPLQALPPLTAAHKSVGVLRSALAARWGIAPGTPVATGAGDNMACAIGIGAARPGDCAITIGTSGVINAVDEKYRPAPERALLTSAHAAPGTFLSMGVVMSATAALDWLSAITGEAPATLAGLAASSVAEGAIASAPVMRPSLSGIRTPHNQPGAGGVIDGLTASTDKGALAYAVLEGVAFQIAECAAAQRAAGVPVERVSLVGGGTRSPLWCQLIATALDTPVLLPDGADNAAAIGAARLAAVAAGVADLAHLARPLDANATRIAPDPGLAAPLGDRFATYAALPRREVSA